MERLYKVEGSAIQDVDWEIVVSAVSEVDARFKAMRGIGTIYDGCRNLHVKTTTDISEEQARQELGSFKPSTNHPYPLEDASDTDR